MAATTTALAATMNPPMFSGENYPIWSVKMKTYLKSLDLWQFIESDEEPQAPTNPTIAQLRSFNEQIARKHKTLAVLHSAISELIFTRILTCETAKQAWEVLRSEFQGSERTRQMQIMNLWREFEILKMKEDQTVKDYTDSLMRVVNQLRLLQVKIDDQRVVEKVLVSVPEKFEAKIASLEEKDLTTLSLAEVINSLQASESRRLLRQEDTSETALYTNSKSSKGNSGGGGSRRQGGKKNDKDSKDSNKKDAKKSGKFPPCKYCQGRNHQERYCWRKPHIKCRACNQMGHVERICKNKTNHQQQPQQAQLADTEELEEEKLFMTISSKAKFGTEAWLIDSACSNHVTSDESIFVELDKSQVTRVKIGNGEWLNSKGKGKIGIQTPSGMKLISEVLLVPEICQNLLSLGQLLAKQYEIHFKDMGCRIYDPNGAELMWVKIQGRCFPVDFRKETHLACAVQADESSL